MHLVLDEGSVCYRGPTWRRLGERGAIWAPFRTELTVKIAKCAEPVCLWTGRIKLSDLSFLGRDEGPARDACLAESPPSETTMTHAAFVEDQVHAL